MAVINFSQLKRSFFYAFKGLKYAIKSEQNFRLHLIIALVVIVLMLYWQIRLWQAIVLLMIIIAILVLEIINTIFEKIVDILKPRIYHYVEIIKDLMAAAVLITAIGAVVLGILIFYPYFSYWLVNK